MKGKPIWSIFWVLVAVFVIMVVMMFVPQLGRLLMRLVFIPAWVVIAVLGVVLIVLTVRTKVAGIRKKFLLLTGASAVGLPVFAVLHNLVSGLFNTEEPVFFILATMVCPIAFLVGAVGTIVLAVKSKSQTAPAGTS